jgi:hypothetical protein
MAGRHDRGRALVPGARAAPDGQAGAVHHLRGCRRRHGRAAGDGAGPARSLPQRASPTPAGWPAPSTGTSGVSCSPAATCSATAGHPKAGPWTDHRCCWRPACPASSPPATSATARSNASPRPSAKAPPPSNSSTNTFENIRNIREGGARTLRGMGTEHSRRADRPGQDPPPGHHPDPASRRPAGPGRVTDTLKAVSRRQDPMAAGQAERRSLLRAPNLMTPCRGLPSTRTVRRELCAGGRWSARSNAQQPPYQPGRAAVALRGSTGAAVGRSGWPATAGV